MPSDDTTHIDLDAFFERIEYAGGRQPTIATMKDVHLAHATHIPFENLDVMLHLPIRIDLESIQKQLVRNRRGGYCFQQNLLLAAVLEQLGFSVTLLQARVRLGAHRVLPRTHVALAIDVAGERWLADVGFGSWGLLVPVPLRAGEYEQYGWSYRVARESGLWVLQAPVGGVWQDLYIFSDEPQFPVDFIPANHYISTHPDSRFVQTLTVQRVAPDIRRVLKNTELVSTTHTSVSHTTVPNNAALLHILASEFLLEFPAGTEFLPESAWHAHQTSSRG